MIHLNSISKLLNYSKVLALLFISNSAFSQNVTVNPGAVSYATLKGAFDAINAGTHTGAITIDIVANTAETAPAVLNSTGIGSASYTSVLLRPINDGVSISGATATGRGLVELNGTDNITIDGDNPNTGGTNRNLTIVNTATNTITYTSVIRVATGTGNLTADNVTLSNLILNGNATGRNLSTATSTTGSENTTFGVIVGPNGSTTTPTAITSVTGAMTTGATANAFVLNNCVINQVARGFAFLGTVAASSTSVTATNNTVGTAGAVTPSIPPFTSPTNTVYTKGIIVQGFTSLTVTGNTIQNIISYVGTVINGIEITTAGGVAGGAISVSNNTLSSITNNGTSGCNGIIFSSSAAPFTIANNNISNVQDLGSASIAGISVSSSAASPSGTISGNKVSTVYARSTSGYAARGILISSGTAISITNNMIWDINAVGNNSNTGTTFGARGIQISGGTNHSILNNTVSLYGALLSGGSGVDVTTALGISSTSYTGISVKNNIFSNTMSGGAGTFIHSCVQLPSGATSTMNLTLNNNAYYQGTGATNYILATTLPTTYLAANFNSALTSPATNSRAYTSTLSSAGTNDNSSFATTAAAPFVSSTNLHINTGTTPTLLESGGMNVGVTTDIDGDVRPGPAGSVNGGGFLPDIGADEFDGVILDIVGPNITYTPLLALCSESSTYTLTPVTITDLTGVPTSGSFMPRIYYNKNGGSYVSQSGVLLSGTGINGQWSFTFDFSLVGGVVFGDVINYYIIAQDLASPSNITSSPAGAVATDVNNVTSPPPTVNILIIQMPLNGVYTVGSGGNFSTLTSAVAAYNTGCVTGPVTFNLINSSYSTGETFPIIINSIPAASSTNTLTIKPTVTTTITGSAQSIIQILGGDYVIIDGSIGTTVNSVCPMVKASRDLTVTNTSTTTPNAVIAISTLGSSLASANPATNITIKNVNVIGGTNSTTTSYGIFNGGAVGFTGFDNDNITIENNGVQTTTVGIGVFGNNAGTAFDNNLIRLCDIGSTSIASSVGQFGIQVRGIMNSFVSKNSIVGIGQSIANLINPKGIDVQSAVTNSTVNLNNITGVRYYSTNGYGGKGIDINTTIAASNLNIVENTISDISGDGWSTLSSDAIVGIRVLSTSISVTGGVNIWNNTVNLFGSIARSGATADKNACLYIQNTSVGNDVRNNIFVNSLENTTGVSTSYAIATDATSSPFAMINNNAYCVSGNEGILGFYNASNITTLAAWQTATTQDAQSILLCPVFVSNTDLHLTSASTNAPLLCGGANIPNVTNDIDCESKKVTPTIGADEVPVAIPASIAITETSGTTNNDGILCAGSSATLTASGGTTYLWSTAETTTAISANSTGTYTVTVTDAGGCATSTSVVITVNPLPTPIIDIVETSGSTNNDGIICNGATASLTATGGGTYLWSTGATTAGISTGTTGIYTVTVTSLGCTSSTSVNITANPLPVPVIAVVETSGVTNDDGIICIGASVSLTASGGTTYLWSSGATTAALNVAPTSTTTYTVTISDANGCSNSGLTTITVNPLPIAGITGTFTACAGSSITLTGTGGTQYLWSNGLTTTSINVIMPSTPSIMGVTVTDINGCTNTTEQALTPLVVPSISTIITQPTTCISTDGTISTTITNATSPTYIWSNGATTSGISGLSVGSYTVTVTSGNNGCTSVAVVGLIGPGGCNVCPTIGTLSISNPVCANTLTTLTASGLTDMGVTFGISFVSFPSATTDPYIGGTVLSTVSNGSLSSGGTVATASVSIPSGSYVIYAILSPSPTDPACRPSTSSALVVNPTPSAAIAITETSGLANNDGIICSGANATLTASGGGTYVWSTGATTGGITTGIAGTYTVTVTNLGCSASTSISITVNPLPIPMIAVVETSGLVNNDGIICSGTSAILTANGGITYAWSTGATTTGITTGTAGTYTVTVTNSNGCTASISSIITVNPLPIPAIAVVETSGLANNDGIICSGASATFTASGGGTYIWSTGATTSGITSGTAGIYTVTVTNSNGCTASASSTLTVNPLPIVTIARTDNSGTTPNDGIICAGATATLTANGGGTYLWSTGATTSGITSGTAGTYTVTVTNSNGCTASVSSTITVNPLPIAAIARTDNSSLTPNDGIICQGAMATLTASGGGTYVWSNGATTAGITTGTAGTYSVTVTSVNGCTASTSSSITVLPLPTPSISVSETSGTVANDGTIYTGSSANLTASGGGTYLWNTGATTSGITVTPSTTTTYTVTVTNANNCSATASTTITVIDPSCLLVCSGDQTITLTNGACEYQLPNLVTGAGDCAYFVVKQTAGPLPGELLKKGTYTITQQLISNLGEIIDECSYTVSVRANPIIVNSLTCNDHVNISVDINCEVTLSPDMFLEGNSYSCYADYQINIWPFNSQANALNNITQNTAMYLPCGNHTYEIVGPSGNRCWGTFTIEDKIAPVVSCNCVDMPVTTPITSFAGSLDLTDPSFARPNGTTVCANTGAGPDFYDVFPFTVSTTGLYTFNAAGSNGDTYAIIYQSPFDPLNPCTNFIIANDDTAGGLDPLITVSLTAGVQYVYVFTTFGTNIATGTYNVTITGAGQVQTVTNPANAPECQFACYELPVVQGETVGMLYDIPGQNANKSKLSAPPAVRDACGPVSMTFEDRVTGSNCNATKLIRDWKFTDAKGNTTLCSQTFTFNQITVFDLVPPVREVHLTCGLDATPAAIAGYLDVDSRTQPASATNIGAYADDYAQTGSVVEFNEGYSYGYFTYQLPGYAAPAGQPNLHSQKVDNNVCNLYTTYTDDVIPACGIGCSGNMKVIRNWKLLDWCTGEVFTYTQVIKATDEKAPTFNVKNATVGVDPWGCAANWNVGQPWELADNCAKAEEIKWGVKVPAGLTLSGTAPNYRITGLTKGVHTITYWASDCCGNVSEKTATLTVIDASAPVAVAKQNIVMSLTGSGTGADGAGKIYGWQIDNGSYDHCSDVRFEVRRVDGGSCGNVGANGTHNNNSTYNDNNGYPSEVPGAVWFHPQDNAQDTDGGEFVKFCCEDIPAGADYGLHDVELRVWDDGNMNGVIGDNDIINGMKDNYNTTWVTIRVENKLPPALVCPPDVTITCDMELNLSLDAETNVNDVNLTMTGYPQAYDLCSNLQVTYKDQWVGSHDPVCKSGTVRRTFKVTKGAVVVTCPQFITVATLTAPFTVTFPNQNQTTEWDKCSFTLDDARDAANASIKRPIVNYGQCDIVGENITIDTFLFEDGACKKWRVKYSYKNWCTGEEINTIAGLPIVHWYAFKDVTAPVLSCTNQMFAANPNPQNPNGGCEAAVALEASASDKLICAEESWIKWQMFFDGWNDGTVDRLGSSFVNKSWNGIWVPQAKYISGVLNPTWVALQNQHPNLPLADLVYVTYIKPTAASGGTAKLPVGTGATAFILNAENISHKVLWKVTDGCGNVDQCESTVMVVDKKAPTPYCVSVSTALMQTNPQMVELWARDFDKGAFDNCTPQSKLYFTFDGAAPIYSRVNEEHFYKVVGGVSVNATAAEYAQGKAYKWLPSSRSAGFVWTAAGDYNVQVSVWDEAWNTDYCTVILSVRGGNGSRVSGTVATASGQGVNDVTVEFATNAPEYPKASQTLVNGTFGEIHPNGFNYTVKAAKNSDFLNGVSTLDLVMIQRHILGLQALDSNYKMIAADANKDGKVTASDLTDLRKLILGVTTTLPNNTSWRFAVAGTPVQTSPIAFTEAINITNLSSEMADQNFVAVKIGDVNGNVSTSVNSPEVESRSNANVEMSVAEASIAAGEVVEIPVTAANFSEVSGFQYTMNLNGASFVGVQGGVLEVNANNVGVISDNVVTMSYASTEAINANEGAVLFTLTVKADKAMKVSEMISLNSEVTRAESYNSDLKVGRVSLGVRTAPVAGIELFQNEPNPFKGMTTVSFEMPEAATATLSVYDVTGKVVTVRNINAIKGLNSEIFTKDQLGVSGVLYYTLVSGDFTATKKMIIVE